MIIEELEACKRVKPAYSLLITGIVEAVNDKPEFWKQVFGISSLKGVFELKTDHYLYDVDYYTTDEENEKIIRRCVAYNSTSYHELLIIISKVVQNITTMIKNFSHSDRQTFLLRAAEIERVFNMSVPSVCSPLDSFIGVGSSRVMFNITPFPSTDISDPEPSLKRLEAASVRHRFTESTIVIKRINDVLMLREIWIPMATAIATKGETNFDDDRMSDIEYSLQAYSYRYNDNLKAYIKNPTLGKLKRRFVSSAGGYNSIWRLNCGTRFINWLEDCGFAVTDGSGRLRCRHDTAKCRLAKIPNPLLRESRKMLFQKAIKKDKYNDEA